MENVVGDNKQFSQNYLLLRVVEAGFLVLFFLLVSSDVLRVRCIESRGSDVEKSFREFEHRWIIFMSILVQKLLILLRRSLAMIGWMIELFLNLLANNDGFLKLLVNILTGELIIPDRESPTFTSLLWSIDPRKDLQGGTRNLPSLALTASKLAYEKQGFLKNHRRKSLEDGVPGESLILERSQGRLSTYAIILKSNDLEVVAFSGTRPFDADYWGTDLDISWHEIEGVGRFHLGFMKALGLYRLKQNDRTGELKSYAYHGIKQRVQRLLDNDKSSKFMVTGHSLGGALAILFVAGLVMQEEEWMLNRMEGVYSFGQPRVGDAKFSNYMNEKISEYSIKYERYVYSNDIAPRLPCDEDIHVQALWGLPLLQQLLLPEKGAEQELLLVEVICPFDSEWDMGVVEELRHLDCIRPDYRESCVVLFLRMAGLVIPGLAEHALQDYNNLTRLNPPPADESSN